MNGPVPIGFAKSVSPFLIITVFCCTNESDSRASGDLSGICTTSGPFFLTSARRMFTTDA